MPMRYLKLLLLLLIPVTLPSQTISGSGKISGSGSFTNVVSNTPSGPFPLGWTPLPGTNYQPLTPNFNGTRPDVQGNSGGAYVMNAWSGGWGDQVNNKLCFAGGGHHDYYGNEVYCLLINGPTGSTMTRLDIASDVTGINTNLNDYDACPDGTQCPRHTYGGVAWYPTVNKVFFQGGGLTGIGDLTGSLWSLTPYSLNPSSTGTCCWTHLNPTISGGPGANSHTFGNLSAYDPNTDSIWVWEPTQGGGSLQGNLWQYTATNNTYVNRGNYGSSPLEGHQSGAIDPVRQKFFAIGNGVLISVSLASGSSFAITNLAGTATGCSVPIGYSYPGVISDPSDSNLVIFVGQGNAIYSYNPDSNSCTLETYPNGPPAQDSGNNGLFNRFQYFPLLGGIAECNSWSNNCYFLRRNVDIPNQLTSFQLTSSSSGTFPFTIGLGFKKGDAPSSVVLQGTPNQQVIVKSNWNDGSIKTAIVSGRVALTANTTKAINVLAGAGTSGTAKTCTNIQTAAPSASVQIGAIGTVNLSSLLASPFRTWVSGPEMVECHYRSNVGADPTMQIWFHVRLYADNRVWVRAVVENGLLDVATANKTYIPTVTIGGTVVYNNGGGSLTHYAQTRWIAEGWIGGDPQLTVQHDARYLEKSKLLPNYMNQAPSAAVLNVLASTYTPMNNADWTQTMGDTGFQNQIGLLPLWDALYATSNADTRAWKAVQNDAKSLNSYAIIWNDSVTHLPVRPTDRPLWTAEGNNGGGFTTLGAGPLVWDVAHHGSGGYLAYIITGDYLYYETMEDQAATCYLVNGSSHGAGVNRDPRGDVQDRGVAWCTRTISQFVALAVPGDTIASDYKTWLTNSITTLNNDAHQPSMNPLGYMLSYDIGSMSYSSTASVLAPWQRHFFMQTLGMGSDIEPLASMTNWNALRDYNYQAAVGILGANGASNYCFTDAAQYNLQVADTVTQNETLWYSSWGIVWSKNHAGASNTSCANTLQGGSGGDPAVASSGYWGNLMPAIAYANDHGAPGASASWARLTGATNWNTVLNSGFGDIPIFGIVPRQ